MSDRFDLHGERPFVSVIIPTFDRSQLLKGAISTIYEQDYPKDAYELIIVDNNSSDDTAATVSCLAEATPVDVIYIKEERPGLVFARHSGAARARGSILVFGDDDGLYERNWISAIVDVYNKHAQVGAVGTSIDIKWDDAPAPWVKAYEGYLGKLHYGPLPVVRWGLQIFGGSFSIRKAVLYAVKGFNPGQLGDYLIGDSETGLCRKLAAAGIPVGCTPATTMWHVQLRDRHGTFQDLKRRFRNNGVVQAYHDTFSCGDPLRIGYGTLRHAHKIVRRILSRLLRSDTNHLGVDALLQINELLYRIKYLFLFRFHPRLRQEIVRRDWELTPEYSVGETRHYARVVATG